MLKIIVIISGGIHDSSSSELIIVFLETNLHSMIKFFRKIRYNLMEQNKTGKYLKYAIGEIVLVMIGILLALQVNHWNNQRLDAKKEQLILKNLKSDFETGPPLL